MHGPHYIEIAFKCKEDQTDLLIAWLAQYPFDTFQEQEEGLSAFIPKEDFNKSIEQYIGILSEQMDCSFTKKNHEPQNYNKLWEQNFSPIQVGDFCRIRTPFHESSSLSQFEILIQPKMAFGTGHHETTYMMVEQMSKLNLDQLSVLDLGCGSGLLAILAKKMDASKVIAIDNDPNCTENTIENASLNHIILDEVILGELESSPQKKFDVILANINRHVILSLMTAFYDSLSNEGKLLLSGILIEDFNQVNQLAEKKGFALQERCTKGNWISILYLKSDPNQN